MVRLSSSIIPTLIEYFSIPRISSTLPNRLFVKATSSGPCILGLTIYTELVLELILFLKSCNAHSVDINASKIPSGISVSSFSIIAELVIR